MAKMKMQTAALLMLAAGCPQLHAATQSMPQAPTAEMIGMTTVLPRYDEKPRLVVITDVANEPDDEASLVRLLLYADGLDIEGLIASTSVWMRDAVHPEKIEERVRAYGQVLPNLRVHSPGYPSMESLLKTISAGQPVYGMAAVGPGKDSPGSKAIIAAADRKDDRPLWITLWGGANVLAQALWRVEHDRSPKELAHFLSRLRIYSISDQDDAGAWLRQKYPQLFWIVSLHAFNRYARATWTGISGEAFYGFEGGPDSTLISRTWLEKHINKGPLGALYPMPAFIMEGDTPSFLGLIPNGLNVPEAPDLGGWGGRYGKLAAASGIWTDVIDTVEGVDGKRHSEAQATIWRWREAYQNDFAARINWSVSQRFSQANHAPHIVIDALGGHAPIQKYLKSGETLRLDLHGSSDPDGNAVSIRCWQYKEPSTTYIDGSRVPSLAISACKGDEILLTAPTVNKVAYLHLIIEAVDDGTPTLRSYRRVMIKLTP